MHLAGWKFTVCEGASRDSDWNILDVKIPNFNEAREVALRQYRPDSFVVDFSPALRRTIWRFRDCRPRAEMDSPPGIIFLRAGWNQSPPRML